jgi:hypothetical protein
MGELHRIRVHLYENYLPKAKAKGKYFARTNHEAMLDIEQVCASLKDRGGSVSQYDALVFDVKQFFNELIYQICDGFAVNCGYFSIHPNIGGTFDSPNETYDPKKNPIDIRYRTRKALKEALKHVTVEIVGLANVDAYVDEFLDVQSDTVDETLTPSYDFIISGEKIKIAGDDPSVGIYFVDANNPNVTVKVDDKLTENGATKLIGRIPALTAGGYKVRIVTQYTSGGALLKASRTVDYDHVLTVS